jgi:hypothetical protein
LDTYLDVAERVLRVVRRPMSALQILRVAYERGVAPPHLRGRTQQKTMGARLSEDILRKREESRFYRTAPGKFLLRELANDPSIPPELRRPIVARRRRRQLVQKRSLAFDMAAVSSVAGPEYVVDRCMVLDLIAHGEYHYSTSAPVRSPDEVVVWAFMIVVRSGHVLSYRQGHYREDRDTFMHRRTIGFYTPVADVDLNFFDQSDHGIVSSGVRALATDLDLQDHETWSVMADSSTLLSFVCSEADTVRDLLAVVSFSCPDWLDPISKRLAINDLEWLDLRTPLNNHDDFDPWSRAVMPEARRLAAEAN